MKVETIQAWVARDKNGFLYLYPYIRPEKGSEIWHSMGENYCTQLRRNLFPQVKWSDKEPTEVELTIKIKEQ